MQCLTHLVFGSLSQFVVWPRRSGENRGWSFVISRSAGSAPRGKIEHGLIDHFVRACKPVSPVLGCLQYRTVQVGAFVLEFSTLVKLQIYYYII